MLGRIDCITGPMFSGKSEELIKRINKKYIAGSKFVIYKPYRDTRTTNKITSRSGYSLKAKPLKDNEILLYHQHMANNINMFGVDLVAFDEAQFFIKQVVMFVKDLQKFNIDIIISGLDTDYSLQPFGAMPDLLALANTVTKLTAVCHNCGADAPYTYRKSNSKQQIIVGDADIYEAACGACHGR